MGGLQWTLLEEMTGTGEGERRPSPSGGREAGETGQWPVRESSEQDKLQGRRGSGGASETGPAIFQGQISVPFPVRGDLVKMEPSRTPAVLEGT